MKLEEHDSSSQPAAAGRPAPCDLKLVLTRGTEVLFEKNAANMTCPAVVDIPMIIDYLKEQLSFLELRLSSWNG